MKTRNRSSPRTTRREQRFEVRTAWNKAVIGFEYPTKDDPDFSSHATCRKHYADGRPTHERVQVEGSPEYAPYYIMIGTEGVHFGADAYPAARHPFRWVSRKDAARVAQRVGGYVESHDVR